MSSDRPTVVRRVADRWRMRMHRRELDRLRAMPRYVRTTTDLLGHPFEVVDGPAFEAEYTQIFLNHHYAFEAARPDPRILDCGANMGVAIAYWKRRWPAARITAFEPD